MITNVRIKETRLGPEDHGIFTAMIFVEGDGQGGGFGGHDLRTNAGQYLTRLLGALKVRRWEDLNGKLARVWEHKHAYIAIGHIIDDSWFCNDGVGEPRISTEQELREIFA